MAQESWNCDTAEGSQQQEGRVLCTNNCGFFGCAATMNLCSKCFRELTLTKQGSPAFPSNTSEKVAAAMAASAERSIISSTLSESSAGSPALPPLSSVVGSEKAFSKSQFSLSSSSVVEPSKTQISLSAPPSVESLTDATKLLLPAPGSSRSLVESTSHALSIADLAPIAALFAPDAPQTKDAQPGARRQSTNRCLTCKKRTGLLGFKCRCGNVFCASHRYSDKHACPFDYKSAGREAIAKANPIVKAQKVERI